MKKVLFMALLLIMGTAMFAEVHYDYDSWAQIKIEWAYDDEYGEMFRENEIRLHVQYEAAQLTVVPFLESAMDDSDITLSFGCIPEDEYGVSLGTQITYYGDGLYFRFSNMHLDPGGLHAYLEAFNYDPENDDGCDSEDMVRQTYEHFLLKSDGSFVSGQGDKGGLSYNLLDLLGPYLPFDYVAAYYQGNPAFLAQQDELRAEYDRAASEILPFLEAVNADADIELNLDYYINEDYEIVYVIIITYDTDDLYLGLTDMSLEEDGLHAHAELINMRYEKVRDADAAIFMNFDDFLLKSDGSFVSGQCTNDDYDNLIVSSTQASFSLLDAHIEDTPEGRIIISDDFELYAGNTYTYPDYDSTLIKVGSATFDWNGNLLSYTPSNEKQDLEIYGTVVSLSSVKWDGDWLLMEGEFLFEDFGIKGKSDNIKMLCANEYVFIDEPDLLYSFELSGFSCTARGFSSSIEGSTWDSKQCLSMNNVVMQYNGESYPLGLVELSLNYDGCIFENNVGFEGPIKVNAIGPDDYLKNLRFNRYGLQGLLCGDFPDPFEGSLEYGSVYLSPDGTVELDDSIRTYGNSARVNFGSFWFSSNWVNQEEDGFSLDEARIGTPANCVITNLALDFGVLYILYDGTAEIRGFGYPFRGPGRFCGLTFSPDEMLFLSDGLQFTGTYYLPDTLPGILSGRTLSLDLVLNMDGSIRQLSSNLQGMYQINIPDTNIDISFDGAVFEVEQRNQKDALEAYTAYLVLKEPELIAMYSSSLPEKLAEINGTASIAFKMDGTLCYKMPGDTRWQPLTIRMDN